jgi:hypothetical protein
MSQSNESMLSVGDFQKKCNRALGTIILPIPNTAEVVGWCEKLLDIDSMRASSFLA